MLRLDRLRKVSWEAVSGSCCRESRQHGAYAVLNPLSALLKRDHTKLSVSRKVRLRYCPSVVCLDSEDVTRALHLALEAGGHLKRLGKRFSTTVFVQ